MKEENEIIKTIISALEKQMRQPVIKNAKYNSDRCPRCDGHVFGRQHFCSQCGQKLDWSACKIANETEL